MWALLGIACAGCEDIPHGGDLPISVPVESVATGFIHKTYRGPRGVESKYVVFVPHAYDGTSDDPAILFLHGAGQVGKNGLDQINGGLGESIRKHEQTFPFITIFPQAHDGSWADSQSTVFPAMKNVLVTMRSPRVIPGTRSTRAARNWSEACWLSWSMMQLAGYGPPMSDFLAR